MGSINTLLVPDDVYNRELLQNADPPVWINPQPHDVYNLVVLGAGTAGRVATAGAARFDFPKAMEWMRRLLERFLRYRR